MTTISTTVPRPASGDAPPRPSAAPPRAGAVFAAMARKECRELGPIIGLVTLAVGAVLAAVLLPEAHIAVTQNVSGRYATACDALLNGAVALMAPLAALLIGFAQFYPESRPDRFALLVHRPVSRTWLFACKAAVGIGLYALTLAVPLLVAFFWASNPYNMPLPFSWAITIPALMDILSGIPFYFAAVLLARRTEARWVGSRLLPVAPPILSALASFSVFTAWWALLATVIATALLALAAQGSYQAAGQHRIMPRVQRYTLGTLLLIALLLAGGAAVGLLDSLLDQTSFDDSYTYTVIDFTREGKPVYLTQHLRGGEWSITDLQGAALAPAASPDFRDATLPMGTLTNSSEEYPTMYHWPPHYFAPAMSTPDGTTWFYAMPAIGGDYFVGFSASARLRVGAIGARGLEQGVAEPQARLPRPVAFITLYNNADPIPARGPIALISAGDTLYRLTREFKLEPLYRAPDPILKLSQLQTRENTPLPHVVESLPVLQTARDVIILSQDDEPHPLVRYPFAEPDHWFVSLGRIDSTGQFLLRFDPRSDYAWTHHARAVYINADGTADHQIELPVNNHQWTIRRDPVQEIVVPMLAPAALIHSAILFDSLQQPPAQTPIDPVDPEYLRQRQQINNRSMLINAAVMLACAGGIFLLTRRRRLRVSAVWLWTFFALLFGPVSFLLLLCTGGLSLVVRCAACGKSGPLHAAACPSCGAARPSPAANGTEIFGDSLLPAAH